MENWKYFLSLMLLSFLWKCEEEQVHVAMAEGKLLAMEQQNEH